ncbi:Uncharacterized protein FKW44_003309 [Caligus rogercresseyi]|uniref:Uncharacterized protein n=2 Tax=Caligus rogercresseyi TaxID=217165 RepID=A0A7T8KLF8_CALRO|nr:Uncharacterized protein FKW44_003309 [Caligus rogercresseyi]
MQKIRQDWPKECEDLRSSFTPDDFQRNIQAGRIGRSFSLKLFLHSSSLDHPPQVCPSSSDRFVKMPVNEKNCE